MALPCCHLGSFQSLGVCTGYHDSNEDLAGFGGGDVHVPDGDGNGLVDDCFFHFDNFVEVESEQVFGFISPRLDIVPP